MQRITIFYRYLDAIKAKSWSGVLKDAKTWFDTNHPADCTYVGAIETDALTEWVKAGGK